ncbi:MAG: FkbM family methyltransferase [Deltaproteobacteria bacterium]|nr:FkbM family methyltransferase [Deltaproteobacteria bacterium]
MRKEIEGLFSNAEPCVSKTFSPFGELIFPYVRMGAIDSLDLFGMDELIIFSFYWTNRHLYKRVVDIGANIGLHSILLSKCGFTIRSYEPDPDTYKKLRKNLELNKCAHVEAINAAVSSTKGTCEFTRVLGNTTGSHLTGSKPNPYGDLERFPVTVESIEPLIEWADLMKIDAEGHEKEILLATKNDQWQKTDALVEIGNEGNAKAVFDHFNKIKINLFAQKTNWKRVTKINDMPMSHRDGTLFISRRSETPWSINFTL